MNHEPGKEVRARATGLDHRSAADPSVEDAACSMCGWDQQVSVYRFEPYGVVRCARCGFHYLSPRLSEVAMLELYRSGEYFEGEDVGYHNYGDQEPALRATFRRVARHLVAGGFAGGDLLEIGAGYGFLLEEARSSFQSVIGTEFSEAAASAARSRGLNVITGGVEAVPEDRQFDLIICAHVVEHVYDPHAFVAILASHLRPGGHLVLGTPDMGSLWRRAMGRRWPSFKIPEHVLYFDRRSLTKVMVTAGLDQVAGFPYPHSFPLSLVLRKVGMGSAGGRLAATPIWLPATTLALVARRPPERR